MQSKGSQDAIRAQDILLRNAGKSIRQRVKCSRCEARDVLFEEMAGGVRAARTLSHEKYCYERALVCGHHEECKKWAALLAKIDALKEKKP